MVHLLSVDSQLDHLRSVVTLQGQPHCPPLADENNGLVHPIDGALLGCLDHLPVDGQPGFLQRVL